MQPPVIAATLAGVVLLTGVPMGAPPITFIRHDLASSPTFDELTVTDVDGDGLLDLVTHQTDAVAVMRQDEDGGYAAPVVSLVPADRLGDVNGDGFPDAIGRAGPRLSVALGNGDGTFQSPVLYDTGPDVSAFGQRTRAGGVVAVHDFTGDGRDDVVSGEFGLHLNVLRVYPGASDGALGTPQTVASEAFGLFFVAVGDLNDDAVPDLVLTTACGTLAILINVDGALPSVATACQAPEQRFWATRLTIADVNGDGNADILGTYPTPDTRPALSVAFGNGDGTRQATMAVSNLPSCLTDGTCGWLGRVIAADFGGDGLVDLALPNVGQPRIVVLPATGPAQWGEARFCATGMPVIDLAGDDVDLTGSPDLAVSQDESVSLFLNRRPGRDTHGGPRSPISRVMCR